MHIATSAPCAAPLRRRPSRITIAQDESEASRFAAELWRGFAAQQQRHEFARGNVVAVSLDELIRDAKAGIVLERVESFFELRSLSLQDRHASHGASPPE